MDKIRILVDEIEKIQTKGAINLPNLSHSICKSIKIEKVKLRENLNKMLGDIFEILEETKLSSNNYEVNNIKFVTNINGSAEISLVSLVKGGFANSLGIEFTIAKKEKVQDE